MKPLIDLPFDALEGITVFVVPPTSVLRQAVVTGVRSGPKGPLLSLTGALDSASARSLAGTTLIARRDDLPVGWDDPEPDPVGMTVTDDEHGLLGEVTDVIVTGANDVWVVEGPLGQVLIPVIDDVIVEFDEDARTVHVELLPGLLDGD